MAQLTTGPSDDVISYVSAIGNMEGGYIVLGVQDGTLEVVGIKDFAGFTFENVRQRIAGNCANLNSERLKVEQFETSDTKKIVWVVHVPKHEPRLPIYAHGKAWQRIGDSLVQMRSERLDAIRRESIEAVDWSAAILDADLSALDETAVALARSKFKERNASQTWIGEVDGWSTAMFLDRAKITAGGKVTRAALLLLGKSEASHFLSPHPCQITWKLETDDRAYEHFGLPFILNTTEVLKKIRNVPQTLVPRQQLLGVEILKYDTQTILEGLHNCIAHQDYERQERIIVAEYPDRLVFENAGYFIEAKPEEYFSGRKTPHRYRNPWLANAMVQVKMIDTMGYGINRMTESQRKRFLPLPFYGKSTATHVVLEVYGRPIDQRYTQLLLDRRDLSIDTIILLDRVQRKLPITGDAVAQLRRERLIEGRKPHFHVAASVAEATGTQATYARSKGMDKARMKLVVLDYFDRFTTATRPKIDELLMPLMPAALSEKQKRDRVKNLLSELSSKDQKIVSEGRGLKAVWKKRPAEG